MTTIPPIVSAPEERRTNGERRKGWHTPDDCPKVNEFQTAMDSIYEHLKEGSVRMEAMEKAIFENNRIATENLERLEKKQDVNQAATDSIAEILEMGEGFFRGVRFVGKWLRKIIMWVIPPVIAIIGFWESIKPHK